MTLTIKSKEEWKLPKPLKSIPLGTFFYATAIGPGIPGSPKMLCDKDLMIITYVDTNNTFPGRVYIYVTSFTPGNTATITTRIFNYDTQVYDYKEVKSINIEATL